MPKISVIVPVYNAAPYLHRCIDSILAQTFTDFELLLIDDGSTDGSGRFCDEYADKDGRIRVFHKENGGVSSARNVGLDNACGEWIAFCDSDDRVFPEWLENFGTTDCGSDVDVLLQGYECSKSVFGDDNNRSEFIYGFDGEGTAAELLAVWLKEAKGIFMCMQALRFSVIHNRHLRFDTQLKHKEDAVFVLDYLSRCNRIRAVNKIGYYYYVPEWNAKYAENFEASATAGESMYRSVRTIMKNNPSNEALRYYREDLTSIYISEFARRREHRRQCIKGLRGILKKDFRRSQMFFPTRLAILLDFTHVFSSLVLTAHLFLHKKQGT